MAKKSKLDKKIIRAVKAGNLERVEALLAEGASPNIILNVDDFFTDSLLSVALNRGHYNVFDALVEAGGDLRTPRFMDSPVLSSSIGRKNYTTARLDLLIFKISDEKLKKFTQSQISQCLYEMKWRKNGYSFDRLLSNLTDIKIKSNLLPDFQNDIVAFEKLLAAGADPLQVKLPENKGVFIEKLANSDDYAHIFAAAFSVLSSPELYIVKLLMIAQESGAEKNAAFLQAETFRLNENNWTVSEVKTSASRILSNKLPQYSLKEVFQFHAEAGERISIFTNVLSGQESITRESFSTIDDQDCIFQAAEALEKAGGQLPRESHYRSKKVVAFPRLN